MKAVQLEFLRGQRRTSVLQWVLVALLLMVLFAAGIYGQQLQSQRENAQASLQQLTQAQTRKRPHPAGTPAGAGQVTEALKAGERISQQLLVPWDRLYTSMEAQHSGDVAILEISPDPVAGKVRISGEARNQDALRNYMNALWKTEDFTSAYLLRQKINDKVAENPIQFTIDAAWVTVRRQ